jgi:hypothetical protein
MEPVVPPEQGDRTDARHLGDMKLHRAYESEVADQNVWQSFMLVSGFFGQVFHFLSGEICAV